MFKNIYVLGLMALQSFAYAEEVPAVDSRLELNERNDVSLKKLDKVQIKADPLGRNSRQLVQPVTVLTADDIRENQAAAIGELLSQKAGVHNASFGAAVGRPVIRGLSGARVKVMQNGIDSLDVGQISPDHAVTVDSQHAHQIEILRGPAALIYGSDAVGGAVNVTDHRIPLAVDDNETNLGLELSSGNEGQVFSLQNMHKFNDLSTHLSFSSRSQDDYSIPEVHDVEHAEEAHSNHLENSAVEQENASVGFAYQFDGMSVGLALSHMDHEFGLPGHGHEEEPELPGLVEGDHDEEPARVSLQQTRLDGVFTKTLESDVQVSDFAITKLNAKFSIVDYSHTEGHEESEEAVEGVDSDAEHDHGGLTTFERKAFESRLGANYSVSGKQQGAFGIQLNQSQFSAHGDEAVVPSTDSSQVALFILHSMPLTSATELELAGRVENNHHDVDKGELDQAHLSECGLSVTGFSAQGTTNGSIAIGINHQGNNYLVRSNLTHVNRTPAVQELFSCGAHESSLSFEIGNPELDSEVSRGVDIGGQVQVGDWVFDGSLYMTQVEDFIYQAALGSQIDDLDAYQYQQQGAQLRGYEVSASYALMDTLTFQLFSDDTIAKFTSGSSEGEYVPRMPAQRIGVELAYKGYLWASKLRNTRYLEQDRLAQFESATSGFDLLSLSVEYQLVSAFSEIVLYSSLQNILNEEVRYHTSFVKDEVLQPGRNLRLGMRYQF